MLKSMSSRTNGSTWKFKAKVKIKVTNKLLLKRETFQIKTWKKNSASSYPFQINQIVIRNDQREWRIKWWKKWIRKLYGNGTWKYSSNLPKILPNNPRCVFSPLLLTKNLPRKPANHRSLSSHQNPKNLPGPGVSFFTYIYTLAQKKNAEGKSTFFS